MYNFGKCVILCIGKCSVRTLYKGVMHMQIVVGDNRLEQAAARRRDAKTKEMEHKEQQSLVQNMEEKEKKASADGVVLEVSKSGVEDFYVNRNEIMKLERIEETDKEQQKEPLARQQMEQQTVSVEQHQVLENINIT